MWLNELDVLDKVRSIEAISKERKNIQQLQLDLVSLLGGVSLEDKEKIAFKMSQINPEDGNQQNNLWFIVPHIIKERFWDGIYFNEDTETNEEFPKRKKWMNYVQKNWDGSRMKNDKWQYVLEPWPTYTNNLVSEWLIFDPKIVRNEDFWDMKSIYEKECINNLDTNNIDIINKLSQDIVSQNDGSKINTSTIIPIPTFYKEKKEELNILIENLLKQDWDMTIVFYVNWSIERYDPNENKNKLTGTKDKDVENKVVEMKEEFDKKYQEFKNKWLINWTKKIITIGHTYDKFPTVGWVKADMIDAIIKSTDEKQKDPIIIWLDADVNEIPPKYTKNIRDQFNNTNDKYLSFICAKRRFTKPNDKDQYLHFAESLFILGDDLIKNKQWRWLSITNGWTTSYRLNDVMKVKWIERNMEIAEDLALWYKINWFHSKDGHNMNMDVKWFNWNKLYADPRRWYSAIKSWISFPYQWSPDFPFKESEKRDIANIEFNNILNDIFSNKIISDGDTKKLEQDINQNYAHLYKWYNNPSFANLLTRFWNYNIWKKTQYRMIENWFLIKIVKK